MAKEESPKDVIDSYRKRQKRSERTPWFIFGIAGILLIIGAALIIFWVTGADISDIGIASLFASDTPTPTATATITPVPPTNTPTMTATEAPPTETPEPSPTEERQEAVIYVVQEGDNFFTISETFGVSMEVLIYFNRERLELDPANPIIKVGDEVLIPPPGAELPTPTALPENLPPGTRIEYSVQSGDTLASIALKFNTTVEDIIAQNEDLEEDPNAIFVGQILIIRVNLVTPAPTQEDVTETPENTPGSISTLTPTP